nr:PREDICTED: zinc finger HIT domain-containing protein 2 [Bemisia tabaci]
MAGHQTENLESIITSPSTVQMSSEGKTCFFCKESESKYVCPRCGLPYCSVGCYRSAEHINCSEQFYRESVEAELKDRNMNPGQMKEILERLKGADESEDEELDSDDEEGIDLAARMENIDLDDADAVWGMLSESERAEFQQLVNSGDISKLLPPWEPWWMYNSDDKPVQEVTNEASHFQNCPKIHENIAGFESMCKVAPDARVKWNLVNIVTAYAYCVRYYNNEHFSFPMEAANSFYEISKNLNSNQIFQSFELAVNSVICELTSGRFSASKENLTVLKSDVWKILAGPSATRRSFYVMAALSDGHCLFEEALRVLKQKQPKPSGQFSKRFSDQDSPSITLDKRKIAIAIKKFDYYLSWSQDFYLGSFANDFNKPLAAFSESLDEK